MADNDGENGTTPAIKATAQIGVDWETNTVVIGAAGLPGIAIPIMTFLQTSDMLRVQMIERIQQAQRGKIDVVGEIPHLRRKH